MEDFEVNAKTFSPVTGLIVHITLPAPYKINSHTSVEHVDLPIIGYAVCTATIQTARGTCGLCRLMPLASYKGDLVPLPWLLSVIEHKGFCLVQIAEYGVSDEGKGLVEKAGYADVDG